MCLARHSELDAKRSLLFHRPAVRPSTAELSCVPPPLCRRQVLSRRPWKAEQSSIQPTASQSLTSSSSLLSSGSGVEVRWGVLPDVAALHQAARSELSGRLKEEQEQAKAEKRRREEKMDTGEGGGAEGKDGDGSSAAAAAAVDDEGDDGRRRRGRKGKKGNRKERRGARKAIGLDDDPQQLASEQIALPQRVLDDTQLELPPLSEQQRQTAIKDLSYSTHTLHHTPPRTLRFRLP